VKHKFPDPELVEKYIINLHAVWRFDFLNAKSGKEKTMPDELINYRDSVMADIVIWLTNYYAGKKIIVIGHNGHIKLTGNKPIKPMGAYLIERLNTNYKSFVFMTDSGSAMGFTPKGLAEVYRLEKSWPDSYEYYFSKLNLPEFYISLKNKNLPVSGLKWRSTGYFSTGSRQFSPVDLDHAAHGLFFIRKSSPSKFEKF
jgi:erythromycin esterase-like protein